MNKPNQHKNKIRNEIKNNNDRAEGGRLMSGPSEPSRASEPSQARHPVIRGICRVMAGVLVFNALSPLSVLAQDKGYVSPAAQRQMAQLATLNQDIERAKAEKARSPADRVSEHQKAAQELLILFSSVDRLQVGANVDLARV
jgi:hypothetical protein